MSKTKRISTLEDVSSEEIAAAIEKQLRDLKKGKHKRARVIIDLSESDDEEEVQPPQPSTSTGSSTKRKKRGTKQRLRPRGPRYPDMYRDDVSSGSDAEWTPDYPYGSPPPSDPDSSGESKTSDTESVIVIDSDGDGEEKGSEEDGNSEESQESRSSASRSEDGSDGSEGSESGQSKVANESEGESSSEDFTIGGVRRGTPKKRASIGGDSQGGTPKKRASIGGDSQGGTPKKRASVGGDSQGGTPKKRASVGGDSEGGTPKKRASVGGDSEGGTPKKRASVGGDSEGGTPKKRASIGGDSKGGTPKKRASVGGDSKGGTPKKRVSVGGGGQGGTPKKRASVGVGGQGGTPKKRAAAGGSGTPRRAELTPDKLQFLEDVKYPWKLIEQLRGVLKMSNSVNNVLELFQNWKIPKKPRQRKNPFDCPCGFEKGIYDVYLLKREADEPGQVHKVHVGPRCVDLFGTAEQAEAGLHLLPRTPLQARFSGMYSSRYVFTVFPERGNLLFTRDTRDFLQGIFDYVFIKPSENTGGAWIIQANLDNWAVRREFEYNKTYTIRLASSRYHASYGAGINLVVKDVTEC